MGGLIRLLACTLLVVAVCPLPVAAGDDDNATRIAVLDFNSMGLSRDETDRASAAFRNALGKTLALSVFEPERMYRVMEDQGYPRQIPCTDDSCMIELGGVLGVSFIVAANLGRIGDIISVSLWMLDVKNGHVVSTVMENYQSSFDAFVRNQLNAVATRTAHAVVRYCRSGQVSSAPREGTWTVFSPEDGTLPTSRILCLAEDLDGVVWIGMKKHGVMSYDEGTWRTFGRAQGLPDGDVWSIAVDNRNRKWFGTIGGGACRFDGRRWKYYRTRDGLASDYVSGIVVDRDSDDIWFMSWDSGVTLLRNGRMTVYRERDGLIDDDVRSMAVTADGAALFGTYKGVSRLDGSGWTQMVSDYTYGQFTDNGTCPLADNYVRAITVDLQGRVWYGTYRGVSCQAGSLWTTYTRNDGLADNDVRDLCIDNYGMLWCATYGGVSRFDGAAWTTYTRADGLAEDDTKTVEIDRRNNKWFVSAEYGISLYTGD